MKKFTNYKGLLTAILLLLATALPSLAQQPTLPTNDDGYYIIANSDDYEMFRKIVATGNPFANAVLTNDIKITSSIGDGPEHFHYRGTFDGQGHFVTLSGKTDSNATSGMFAFTEPGCVIRNLGLDGILQPEEGKKGYLGALVNEATGTRIENCFNRVSIYGKDGSGLYLGGFIGVSRGKCFIEDCAFAGQLLEGSTLFGFVAHNEQNLSIKGCYSTTTNPSDKIYSSESNFFTDKIGDGDVNINNYFLRQNGVQNRIADCFCFGDKTTENYSRLAYQLNMTSKKGVIWYKSGDFLIPFKGDNDTIIVSKDGGSTVEASNDCSHSYSDHICSYCGAIEPDSKIEPLQNHENLGAKEICIDNIIYLSELNPETNELSATVKGIKTDAKAVHIPETINIKGDEYPVRKISEDAFSGSSIEYIYIPKSVSRTLTSFKGCSKLKYVHIADGSDPIAVDIFADCPLEKAYIGRDLGMIKEGPFTNIGDSTKSIALFWGPRTTTIGNVQYNSLSTNFRNGKNINGIYLLGDEKSPKELKVIGNNDLSQSPGFFYINRNVTGALSSENRTGLFDYCTKATYGPFVNTIAEESFGSENGKKELMAVDFKDAYNLETIGAKAFKNSKLSKITIPSFITTIEAGAFDNCENLKSFYFEESDQPLSVYNLFQGFNLDAIYTNRDFINVEKDSSKQFSVGILTIGPKVTKLSKSTWGAADYESLVLEGSENPLHFDDYFSGGVTGYVLNRDMICDKDDKYALPFSSKSKTTSASFGDNFTNIYDNMFEGYEQLKYVLLPSSITEVGTKAFSECKAIKVVSILGEPNIKDEAFAKCDSLMNVYFMGKSVQLGNNVFKECPIEEVTTNFVKDPGTESSDKAFDDKTYNNAQLININNAEFVSNPWVKFSSINPNKTNISENAASGNDFDRASVHHNFPVDEFDMVYLPFDMDSYYFGVDAEIYRLDLAKDEENDARYRYNTNTTIGMYALTTDNIGFVKVDIDNEKKLKRGNVYFIKVKHEEDKMAAYFNFFENNTLKVVNSRTLSTEDLLGTSQFQAKEWDVSQDYTVDSRYYYYTYNEGVMKRINGIYHPGICKPLLVSSTGSEKSFYMTIGEDTITTSVSNIVFNENLEGYTSFYAADYNYIAPNWINVYIITSTDGSSVTLEAIEDRTINKGEAVLLKSDNVSYKIANDDKIDGGIKEHLTYALRGSSSSYVNNILKGVKEDTPVDQVSSAGSVYVLGNNAEGKDVGLYKMGGEGTIPAGKAYLDSYDLDEQLAANNCVLICSENTTGIKSVPAVDSKQGIYDLMGRRLKEVGFKGIYIINNQKVIIK